MVELIGEPRAQQLREVSLASYAAAAAEHALTRSIIIADTKFEFTRR